MSETDARWSSGKHTVDWSQDRPNVRWDGVSHEQIVAWTKDGAGAKTTAMLEDGLKNAAEALTRTGDLINSVLQRVNGGEWAGNAATVATRAMQVMRDFDDSMTRHSTVNHLAAYGQSDNANWAKTSIPPVVDLRAARVPTGNPVDVLGNTVDYQQQQAEAKDAEEKARQVMREYQTMTTDRIAALPPLPPAPRLVVADEPDTITVPDGGKPNGSGSATEYHQPPPVGGPGGPAPDVRDTSGTGAASPRPDGTVQSGARSPAGTDPSGTTTGRPPLTTTAPVGAGQGSDPLRSTVAPFTGVGGGPGARGGPSPLRGGGQPVGAGPRGGGPGAGPRYGGPGPRGGAPETVGRGGTAEVLGRGGAKGGTTGMAPVGAAGAPRSDEDKEHQVKYGVPGSEIFEPDHDDGLLHDPFRPGSYVAPSSIGDEDDE